MGKTVICPGSFDPVTLGHLDIITRASKLFDHVIVAVLTNLAKKPSFTIEERIELLKKPPRALIMLKLLDLRDCLPSMLKKEMRRLL